jgi:hypothetical protein
MFHRKKLLLILFVFILFFPYISAQEISADNPALANRNVEKKDTVTIPVVTGGISGVSSGEGTNISGKLKLKSFCIEFITSGGIQFLFGKKVQLCLGMYYSMMLTELSDYTTPSPFRLSIKPKEVNSMMEGSNKVSSSAMGFKVSFRYFFK